MVNEPEGLANQQGSKDTYLDNGAFISSNVEQDTTFVENDNVRPNDHKVLGILKEDGSSYSFRGMMRKLEMHQESLSRSLQRLDDLGLIEKSKLGYKLSRKGGIQSKRNVSSSTDSYIPLLQTYIPSSIDVNGVIYTLAGRWFKNLRWLGILEGEMGHMLQWKSEDGSFQLNLRIISNYIIIETNAIDEKYKVEAMVCAHKIFELVTKLFSTKFGSVLPYTFSKYRLEN